MYEATNLLIAALSYIQNELCKDQLHSKDNEDPFSYTEGYFINGTFEVRSCKYCSNSSIYNFKWKEVEISWYKQLGQDTYINVKPTPDLIEEMLDDCLISLSIDKAVIFTHE